MPKTNAEIVTGYFQAYQNHQASLMCADLAPDAAFSDLAFPSLTGESLRMMWRWFCARTDKRGPIDVPEFAITAAEGAWVEVRYRVVYRLDGREVDYWIRSRLTVQEGRIVEQADRLGVPKWRFAWMVAGFPKCLAAYTKKFDEGLHSACGTGSPPAEWRVWQQAHIKCFGRKL